MYIIYHIIGTKVGCTKDLHRRMVEQKATNYEVLEVVDNVKEASMKEIYWQEKLGYGRDHDLTYEQTLYLGKLTRTTKANAKRKASLATSDKWKASISVRLKAMKTPEAIEKNRISNMKSILQYDLNGVFIKEWSSILEAKLTYGWSIQQCLLKKQNTAYGFIWKYKNISEK